MNNPNGLLMSRYSRNRYDANEAIPDSGARPPCNKKHRPTRGLSIKFGATPILGQAAAVRRRLVEADSSESACGGTRQRKRLVLRTQGAVFKPSKPGLGSLGPCLGPYTRIDAAQGCRQGDDDGLRGRLAEAVLAKYYSAYTGKD